VNSEEIEISLKAEFEGYLKEVSDSFSDKLSQLQAKIDEEIDRHKAEFGKVLSDASAHFESGSVLKPAFADIVAEHLKLARDEGSQISAKAFAEAEKYEKENAPVIEAVAPVAAAPEVSGNMHGLRDAIRDVSDKPSQVEILKSLIQNAGEFAPRGAFFVLKNERFGGWKTFGKDADADDDAIKHVSFSTSEPSVVNESVKYNEVRESSFGEFAGDSEFLKQVGFGEPAKMYAVPLVVRGRTVAVLYADQGEGATEVNVAALETLVQVASMRVELLASLKGQPEAEAQASHEGSASVREVEAPAYPVASPSYEEAAANIPAYEEAEVPAYETQNVTEYSDASPTARETPISKPVESFYDAPVSYEIEDEASSIEVIDEPAAADWQSNIETFETNQPQSVESVEEQASAPAQDYEWQSNYQPEPEPQPAAAAAQEFEVEPSYDAKPAPSFEGFAPVTEAPSFAKDSGFESFKKEPEVVENSFTTEVASQPVSTPVKSRLSERNVDLPIEVSDDERRLHNDARRFARLLVSEIKLYNEAKVKEGRENGDIYNRLQEAVDRSREMYDKRVQPAVAGRFDYFHYELVNSLAEGDQSKLGSTYPGATV
jgi:hypothetical protein